MDDLKDFAGASAEQIELEHLSPEAGAAYLAHLGVKGTNDELRQAANEFNGHALALTLLGRYLAVVYHGDVRQRDKIAQLTKEKKQGGHARRVMESYAKWFEGKPELNILHIMGLFDRPAEGGAIEALKAKPAIAGLTEALQELSHEDWQYALHNLREARLLAKEEPQNSGMLDCHPLVREHFGEKLKAGNLTAWKEAHGRLYEYYKALPKKEYPDTIEEMMPLYAAVAHGCEAGRYEETLHDVYERRILRESEYFSTRKLGAFGVDLAVLSGFFQIPWSQPIASLSTADKIFVLGEVGYRLRGVGRLAESIASFKQVMQDSGFAQDMVGNPSSIASNISQLYTVIGDLPLAVDFAEQSVILADRNGNAYDQIATRTIWARVLHQMGNLVEAESIFRDAEYRQGEREVERPFLYSSWGFLYCDLLLNIGNYLEVGNRVVKTIEWTEQGGLPLEIALEYLTTGRVQIFMLEKMKEGDFNQTLDKLECVIYGLRQAGRHDYLPCGFLARAEFFRLRGEFKLAQRDLDEAFTIATRGGMRLHEADCHLEYARLHLAMGEKDKARESWAKAKQMIEEMGYHRRDPEIHLIEAQFHLASAEKDKARESLAKAKELIDKMGMHRWDFEAREIEKQIS